MHAGPSSHGCGHVTRKANRSRRRGGGVPTRAKGSQEGPAAPGRSTPQERGRQLGANLPVAAVPPGPQLSPKVPRQRQKRWTLLRLASAWRVFAL